MNLEIKHDPENRMFHTFVNGKECYLKYREVGPTILEYFVTYVPVLERNQGIGTTLVEEALHYAQLNNYLVAPTCNFVADYMKEHPEFEKMWARPA